MTWTASQANELDHNLICAAGGGDLMGVIPNIYVGTMGVRGCKNAGSVEEVFKLVFSLLIRGSDNAPLLWKVTYTFYTAVSPDELISSISSSYSVRPINLNANDAESIRRIVDTSFRPVVGWQLTNEISLVLGAVNQVTPGVRIWELAVWRGDLLSKHQEIIKLKQRELYPLPKLD
jgi:hypothetical protein